MWRLTVPWAMNSRSGRHLGGVEHLPYGAADAAVDLLQRGDQVVEELGWVIVRRVQRNPGDLARAGTGPFGDQRHFAKAGRGGDQHQPVPESQPFVQPLDQARTRHQVRARRRDMEFGGQQRCLHALLSSGSRLSLQAAPILP
jgi:hypothetical protein